MLTGTRRLLLREGGIHVDRQRSFIFRRNTSSVRLQSAGLSTNVAKIACLLVGDHRTSEVSEFSHLLARGLPRANLKTSLRIQQYFLTVDKQEPEFVTVLFEKG